MKTIAGLLLGVCFGIVWHSPLMACIGFVLCAGYLWYREAIESNTRLLSAHGGRKRFSTMATRAKHL